MKTKRKTNKILGKIIFCSVVAVFSLLTATFSSAQAVTGVSINTTGNSADPTAMLDVSSSTLGLLLPRVALTSSTSILPLTVTPANSLLVYNTATANDVKPGFYYWNSTKAKWLTLGGSGSDPTLNYIVKGW